MWGLKRKTIVFLLFVDLCFLPFSFLLGRDDTRYETSWANIHEATPWKGSFADFFDDDFDGLIEKAKIQMDAWEQNESFIGHWKLDDTPIYNGPKHKEKRKFIKKVALKYLDKKIMDKGNKSPKSSPANNVVSVRKAMSPSSTIGLTNSLTVKLRAKILEGNLSILLLNPFVDSWMELNNHGHFSMTVKRNFEDLRLEAMAQFSTNEETLKGLIKYKVTDPISGQYEVTQKNSQNLTDHKISLHYLLVF